ncbi:MAG: hypothetical protein ABSH28_06560 [Acidobacteriota bacterium]|jgi:hypothetical protein
MAFSGILDNVIALVVIILVLSLIVQSVQQVLKKLFKIKSRQIQESLLDLFETVLAKGSGAARATAPVLDLLPFRKTSLDLTDSAVKNLFTSVTDEFRKLGRVAQSGRLMLDSIAKDDLLKVVRKVRPDVLLGGSNFGQELQLACDAIAAAQNTLATIKSELLTGSASADFAALRDRLAPIINDLSALTQDGKVKTDLLIEHILNLREISVTDIFDLLGKVQDELERQLAAAPPPYKADLEAMSKGLRDLASALTALRQNADRALVTLRTGLSELGTWFDTVMKGFEERYTRGMKTWGLVVSFLVVVMLNANVFDMYAKISGNDQVKSRIMQMADTVEQKVKAVQPAPAAPPVGGQQPDAIQDLKNSIAGVKANVDVFTGLQFQTLTRADIKNAWENKWTLQNLKILLGWIIMTMLLSVGAPFWEDTLESLFGVKNLLRQKGSIQSVQDTSGKASPAS